MILNSYVYGGGSGALTFSDDFSTNTIASYTATTSSGSPVWAISGGIMGCTGAASTQTCLTRNDFSATDCAVECITDAAVDSGLVLRFQDQSNFYLLAFTADNPTSSMNFRIFKRVSGTFTQLGSNTDLNWPNGSSRTIRFAISGTTLSAYMNGALALSVTDSGIASAGKIGMRGNSVSSVVFNSLAWG